jgi:hypothetical protein
MLIVTVNDESDQFATPLCHSSALRRRYAGQTFAF